MTRRSPEESRRHIVTTALFLAANHPQGYAGLSRSHVARECKCSRGLVTHYFRAMEGLRCAVMREAIAKRNLVVLAQGLAASDPIALQASALLRKEAADHMVRV